MKTKGLILLSLALFIGCQNSQQAKKTSTPQSKEAFVPVKSYAVVWNWTEGNTVEGVLPIIQKQVPSIIDLWRKGVIENAYIENESKLNENEKYPNAFFVIKGKNEQEVRAVLEDTPAFKAGITKYELYPIGMKWLNRNDKSIQMVTEGKKSFATVWTIKFDKKFEQFLEQQNQKILELWNKGVIENAYLDVGNRDQKKPPLVFFTNAQNAEEADKFLKELPFVKENVATYTLYPVGYFWMSSSED